MPRRRVLLAAAMTGLLAGCTAQRRPGALSVKPDVTGSGTPSSTPSASLNATPSPSTHAGPPGQPLPGSRPPTQSGSPIGSGWTEIFPSYHVDQPPGQIRHSLNGGEHHFWVSSTDASTFPGHDSGPRSELRFNNNYSSGQSQFEADIKVISGTFNPCVMQIFGAATQATTFMTTHAPPARHPRPRQVSDASIPPASYRPPIDLRGGQAPAASNTTRARCAGPARATDKPGSRPKTSLGEPGQGTSGCSRGGCRWCGRTRRGWDEVLAVLEVDSEGATGGQLVTAHDGGLLKARVTAVGVLRRLGSAPSLWRSR